MATNKNKECKIVSQLVKDPKAPPETRILAGYLGRSALEGHCRLYRDATLNDWVEIPEDAILHMEDWPPASHTWGGKHVWVQRDAQLVPAPHRTEQPRPYPASVCCYDDPPSVCCYDTPPSVCCQPKPPSVCCQPKPPSVCCQPKPPSVCCYDDPPSVCCPDTPPAVCCPDTPPPVCCQPKPPSVCCHDAWPTVCCRPPAKSDIPGPCQPVPCCGESQSPWEKTWPSRRWNPRSWNPWGYNPYGW